MSKLKTIHSDFPQLTRKIFYSTFQFNLLWGRLLLVHRERNNVSVEDIAKRFRIDPLEVARWECGFGSPQCRVFVAIMRFLGSEAMLATAQLHQDLFIKNAEEKLKRLQANWSHLFPCSGFLGAVRNGKILTNEELASAS